MSFKEMYMEIILKAVIMGTNDPWTFLSLHVADSIEFQIIKLELGHLSGKDGERYLIY